MEIVGESEGTLEWESQEKNLVNNKNWFYDPIQKRKKLIYKTIYKNYMYIDMINDFLLNFNKNNIFLEDYKFYKTIYERIL